METKFIPYELSQAIFEAGIEEANTSKLVYCDCPEWDDKKPLEITRDVAELLKSHSHKANIYPRYTIDEALRLMREALNVHTEIHVKDNRKWSFALVDISPDEDKDGDNEQTTTSEEDDAPVGYFRIDTEDEFDTYDDAALDAVNAILMLIKAEYEESDKMLSVEEYAKFCADAENMRVYDGRGVYDLYRCEKCGHSQFTTYADKGVTPFTMRCSHCDGTMMHVSSSTTPPVNTKVLKWVRPTYEQYCNLSADMRQHVENGGLILMRNVES